MIMMLADGDAAADKMMVMMVMMVMMMMMMPLIMMLVLRISRLAAAKHKNTTVQTTKIIFVYIGGNCS